MEQRKLRPKGIFPNTFLLNKLRPKGIFPNTFLLNNVKKKCWFNLKN